MVLNVKVLLYATELWCGRVLLYVTELWYVKENCKMVLYVTESCKRALLYVKVRNE
jgi:hypothetical protein